MFKYILFPALSILPGLSGLSAQAGFQIVGPSSLCLGSCGTYAVVSANGDTVDQVTWNLAGQPGLSAPSLTVCGDNPGILELAANGFSTATGMQFELTLPIAVSPAANLSLVPAADFCPDSTTACDRVCAFQLVTYEVSGNTPGSPLSWEILGADSYDVTGTSATVQWGAAGQGLVSVQQEAVPYTEPFQLFCGMWDFAALPNGEMGGAGYVTALGGTAPYQLLLSSGFSTQVFPGTTQLPVLPPGSYAVTLTDAAGQIATCDFAIAFSDADCWASAYPTAISHTSACDTCDGTISVQTQGLALNFSFLWSNGSTTKDQTNLCPGTYSLTLTNDLGCSSVETFEITCDDNAICSAAATRCVQVQALPQAAFHTLPGTPGDTLQVCRDQAVSFQNFSTGATSYQWHFGNLGSSTAFEPTFSFPEPGTYSVELIARNECFCSDSSRLTVVVLPAEVPDILCDATLCQGQTATYFTDAACDSFSWLLDGDYALLAGGGTDDDFLTVQWLSGSSGTVSLLTDNCGGTTACPQPNVVTIPILAPSGAIDGPTKVCQGSFAEYTVPDWQGTDIQWEIVGDGLLMEGQGSRRAVVRWGEGLSPNPHLVIVRYDNCYLGCQGSDTLPVNILPGYFLEGLLEACRQDSLLFRAVNTFDGSPVPCTWSVVDADGAVAWTGPAAATALIPFDLPPGTYTVHSESVNNTGFCTESYDRYVKVFPLPPPVSLVDGPTTVCPLSTQVYTAQGLPGAAFSWSFSGGTPITAGGNPSTVSWSGAPPFAFSVIQTAPSGPGCRSEPLILPVLPADTAVISANDTTCVDADALYLLSLPDGLPYVWSLEPANAGTIVDGQGQNLLTVRWHTAGPATVTVGYCGVTTQFDVFVRSLDPPSVLIPTICEGQEGTVETVGSYFSYRWKDAAGNTLSTIANASLQDGHYQLVVTDALGCSSDTWFNIERHPLPQIAVSTPSYPAICPGSQAVDLYALSTGAGYSYAWTLDGQTVGADQPVLSVSQAGNYQVVATDAFGCQDSSQVLPILDCAAVGGVCNNGTCQGLPNGPPVPLPGCVPDGSLDFSIVPSASCALADFQANLVNAVPGSLSWVFGDPDSGPANFSDEENPSHTFSGPGFYTVLLSGAVQAASPPGAQCPLGVTRDFLVPAAALFNALPACPGAPTLFQDLSVAVTGSDVVAWAWDFGDPSAGADNFSQLANPSHVYASEGDYQVTLSVTATGGCQSDTTLTVSVLPLPVGQINLPTDRCEGIPLPFSTPADGSILDFAWSFGDPNSGSANAAGTQLAYHAYPQAGSYPVSLTLANAFGCSRTLTDTVLILPNTLSGDITLSQASPVCEGDSVLLSAPAGASNWLWQDGQSGPGITATTTGLYSVTLTDDFGCRFSPEPVPLTFLPGPVVRLRAVQYDEYGQFVAFSDQSVSLCEGDPLFLLAQGGTSLEYTWSNGETNQQISFTADKDNLLPAGSYTFSVTATDTNIGCSSVAGPFTVTVHPAPEVSVSAQPAGILCEGTQATLSVDAPDPAITYTWNTGATANNIQVVNGGTYFVQAVSQTGCRTQSNPVILRNGPDVDKIPTGCHNRCGSDTICLPPLPDAASFQWLLDGVPIPAPDGTQPNLVLEQSGNYTLVLTDSFGCTTIGDPISVEIATSLDSIDLIGNVWLDINNNGIIDSGDQPAPDIVLVLLFGNQALDTTFSASDGSYGFPTLPIETYALSMDTSLLPDGWGIALQEIPAPMTGCSEQIRFDWLLYPLCPSLLTGSLTIGACPGDSAFFLGTNLPIGAVADFPLLTADGCDSILTVTVTALPTSTGILALQACPGDSAFFLGQGIPPGESAVFTLDNNLGCDSVLTVSVSAYETSYLVLDAIACQDSFFWYDGQPVPAGSSQLFFETNANGCQDTVEVAVAALISDTSQLLLTACGSAPVSYGGQTLFAGDVQFFVLDNADGCDSVVQVSVLGVDNPDTTLQLRVCPDELAEYNGLSLPPGTDTTFVFTTQQGCDSLVRVSVAWFPPVVFTVSTDRSCPDTATGSVAVAQLSGGAPPYQLSLDGLPSGPGDTFPFLLPGNYELSVLDGNGCRYAETVPVLPVQPMQLDDPTIGLGCVDSISIAPQVSSELPLVWDWENGATTAAIWVSRPGAYRFRVSNACETLDGTVTVVSLLPTADSLMYVPNAFSPDFNGLNDCFQPFLSPDIVPQRYLLRIFDRWGNQLFESDEPAVCWDGSFRDKPLDGGVYVWYLDVEAVYCGQETLRLSRKGGLHLIR
jgi:gliding motility-associated-like protein